MKHVHTLSLVLLGLCISDILCYNRGEIVSFSKRSKVGSVTTDWSDTQIIHRPRFLIDKTVTLSTLDLSNEELRSDFKLQFSFDRGQFLTPWITINDGNKIISEIQIMFSYSEEGEIKQFKSKVTYIDASKGVEPVIRVQFEWNFFGEEDFTAGLGFLCLFPFLAGMFLLIFICVDSQFLTSSLTPAYLQPHEGIMPGDMSMMSDPMLYSSHSFSPEYSEYDKQYAYEHAQHNRFDESAKNKHKNI